MGNQSDRVELRTISKHTNVMKTKLLSLLAKFWPYMIGAITAFFTPMYGIMITLAVLMLIDSVLGAIAAKKRGDKITIEAFLKGFEKVPIYLLVLIACQLVQNFAPYDFKGAIVKAVSSIFVLIEFRSVIKNASEITGVDIYGVIVKHIDDRTGIK